MLPFLGPGLRRPTRLELSAVALSFIIQCLVSRGELEALKESSIGIEIDFLLLSSSLLSCRRTLLAFPAFDGELFKRMASCEDEQQGGFRDAREHTSEESSSFNVVLRLVDLALTSIVNWLRRAVWVSMRTVEYQKSQ